LSARSYLYVPGDQPEKLAKAAGRGADALIVDLEDAVAPENKELARRTVRDWLGSRGADGPPVWVRVNSGPTMSDDLSAIAGLGSDGVMVPKASRASVEQVRELSVIALIETAAGLVDAVGIASCPGVVRLAIGEADLAVELGVEPSPGEPEFAYHRAQVVLASAAAGLDAPIAPVSTDFRDLDALRASTLELRRMGFGARSAIHPAQVQPIHEAFTPSPDELARARRLVELFHAAGGGVCVDDEGRMVDEPVVRAARRLIGRSSPGVEEEGGAGTGSS